MNRGRGRGYGFAVKTSENLDSYCRQQKKGPFGPFFIMKNPVYMQGPAAPGSSSAV